MSDSIIRSLQEQLRDAAAAKRALRIRGGGSKDFYGGKPDGEVLDVSAYRGVIDYEPKELVLTVRAGTPLAEVERALADAGQMLPFEPPHFGAGATIGGTVATGLSGPRRPYTGSVRDFVLGARIINGKAEDLSFGGRVIKNVAGYDVSRLMVGAMGTLGVLLDLSFKVLPKPKAETTLAFHMDDATAIRKMNEWAGQPLPLSAAAFHDEVLRIRLSGAESAVKAAREKLGADAMADADVYWKSLREQTHPFFANANTLLRCSLPQTAVPLAIDAPQLMEWGGGLRWLSGDLDVKGVRAKAHAAGGHVTLFRGGDKTEGVFHPLEPAVAKIHKRLKDAFDPAGILNPGRMYDFADM